MSANTRRALCDDTRPIQVLLEGLNALRKAVFVWLASPTRLKSSPCRCSAPLDCSIILILSFQVTACPKKKPDPMPLLHACSTLDILPPEMLLIGDSLNDAEAARARVAMSFAYPMVIMKGAMCVNLIAMPSFRLFTMLRN